MATKKRHYQPHMSPTQRRKADKQAARMAMLKKNRKPLTIAAIALAAVILVVALVADYVDTPNGSIRTFLGNVIGAQESSIIRKVDNLYYEFGQLATPEGYTRESFDLSTVSDKQEKYQYFVTDDESKAVKSIYAVGVSGRTGAEMMDVIAASAESFGEMSDSRSGALGGQTVHYAYTKGTTNPEDETAPFTSSLLIYADTVANSCILLRLVSVEAPEDAVPTEETMVAEAETILAGLTIPAK